MEIEKIKAALIHLPHIKKVWVDKSGAFYLQLKKDCEVIELTDAEDVKETKKKQTKKS